MIFLLHLLSCALLLLRILHNFPSGKRAYHLEAIIFAQSKFAQNLSDASFNGGANEFYRSFTKSLKSLIFASYYNQALL